MKKIALSLAAAGALVLGTAGAAEATAYPPNGQNVTVDNPQPAAGEDVNVTANCTLGEEVTFALGASRTTATCEALGADVDTAVVGGTATGTVTAPTTAGAATGTVTGTVSGDLGSFQVVVQAQTDAGGGETPTPGGQLPATGSDGTSTMTLAAGGLLVTGLGMFAVASMRRRPTTVA